MFHKTGFSKTASVLTSLVFLFFCAASTITAQSLCIQQQQSKTLTYTSSFGTDGSAKATFALFANVLTVEYKNTSTSNTYLSGIGFNADPHILPENLATATATNGWSAVAGPGGGLGSYDLIAYGNGKNRLSPNKWGTAVFVLSSTPQQLCISTSIVHLTSLPNGNSEKPVGVPVTGDSGNGNPDVGID